LKNFFKDISHCWSDQKFPVIFDVGSNKGLFVSEGKNFFPNSKYYAFEPSTHTFDELIKKFSNDSNVFCHKIALNNFSGDLPFTKDFNVCNSLVIKKESDTNNTEKDKLDVRMRALSGEKLKTETVRAETLDSFCNKNNIKKIDILKIDTEGFDLQVIQGSSQMLANQNIDIVYSELTFSKDINKFSSVFDAINLLWLYNYEVFRIYDQASVNGKLRRANVVFVSKNLRDLSTKNIWQ
jgi:FkbM family methyltransferase